jgi:predicted Zn-dependent protease
LASYLKSGWVNGLDETSVRNFSVNGLKAASARAQAKGWFFDIAVIQTVGGATYRFIFANDAINEALARTTRETVASFRTLGPTEVAGLKALRLRVIVAEAGDSETLLARRMRGVDRPLELFRLLNDLPPGGRIKPGTSLKIISDG